MSKHARLVLALLTIITIVSIPAVEAAVVPEIARKAMVVAPDELASKAGLQVIRAGGNAVDAAVTVGFMLAVTYPWAGNLGGGGFMVIRLKNGTVTTVDFREKAPLDAMRNMYQDENGNVISHLSKSGYLAAGVPGAVAGYSYALTKYGRRSLGDVLEPAIQAARDGFAIPWHFHRALRGYEDILKNDPPAREVFWKDGKLIEAGDLLVQECLAGTLEEIAVKGADGFYRGETAQRIARAMKENGGIMTLDDLRCYEAKERPPVTGVFRGCTVYSMAPPSSGGILLVMMLRMLEYFPLREYGFGSSKAIHILTEVEKRAFRDRAQRLGDADFARIPAAGLTSPEYAERLVRTIDTGRTYPHDGIPEFNPWASESPETTHFSVVDEEGNAVSCTITLNDGFGAKVMVPGAGFFLNDEMDDFSAKPGFPNMFGLVESEANTIEPEKRMMSSMTPAIITRDDEFFMAIGSPGGPRIISTVLQSIVNVIEFGMNIQEAVSAPRIHHQWIPDKLFVEPWGVAPDIIETLEKMGHVVEKGGYFSDALGIVRDLKSGYLNGGIDPRQNGFAAGY